MAKVLFIDIETSPNIAYVWGKWQQDVIAYKEEWHIMSIAWKWEGGKVESLCLGDTGGTDKRLCMRLHRLFNEADFIVGHNGNSFDIKKSRARFLFHGLTPTKILTTVDTKLVAKRYFSFNSNSLDDLGKHLNLGRKIKHEGFDLWLKCMAGDKSAWKRMSEYNRQDVELLERVYNKLKPWITNHPNVALIDDKEGCPNCGSINFRSEGIRCSQKRRYRRLQCKDCFAWHQGALVK